MVSANKEESCSLTEFKAFSLVAQNSLSTRGPGKGSLLMNDDGSQSNASCKGCKIQVMIKIPDVAMHNQLIYIYTYDCSNGKLWSYTITTIPFSLLQTIWLSF